MLRRTVVRPRQPSNILARRGVSLVEVLVGLVIVALLIAIGAPAVQSARESARAAQCRNHLAQIGLGLDNYHATHGTFPAAAVWKAGPLSSKAGKDMAAIVFCHAGTF